MNDIAVKIIQINWIDKQAYEADILFQVKGKEFWAFCHPCDFYDGEDATANFTILEEEISDYAFWHENEQHVKDIIPSKDDNWRYYCYGKIISVKPALIDCDYLVFDFGDWINDDNVVGSYVYFVISRLDIQKASPGN